MPFLAPAVCLTLAVTAFAEGGRPVTVVASAETHAMLDPCDCPDAPGGGLAQRATVLKALRDSASVVLVDAGGFAGGGVYDTYSEGRVRDSLRTLATIRAMGLMAYDAVLVGDDDLQFGARWLAEAAEANHVPLVCANCRSPGGEPLFAPWRIVERGGMRIGITGVTAGEPLFETDTAVSVLDPASSLRAVWDTLVRRSDIQIVLSHLGEEKTLQLAAELTGVDLVVNAHRKRGVAPLAGAGPVPVLNFGFQGKALSTIRLEGRQDAVTAGPAAWVPVGAGVPADSSVTAAIAPIAAGSGLPPFDLYIMSQCPHGLTALGQFLAFTDRFPSTEWRLWFVGDAGDDGRLESLRGPDEVADECLWLAIRELHPSRWVEFLRARAAGAGTTAGIAAGLGLDTARLGQWARSNGGRVLRMHYRRSTRLGVDASPTLMRGNSPVPFEVSLERLAWDECRRARSTAVYCDSLPGCLEDADCRAPRKLGVCAGQGKSRRCEFRDDAKFAFTVVSADSAAGPEERSALATTAELFPAARLERVLFDTRKGRKLFTQVRAEALPLYLFGRGAEAAANFGRVKDGLVRAGEYYTFRPGVMTRSFFPNRPRTPGAAVVFLDPVAPFVAEAIGVLLNADSGTRVLPVIFRDTSTQGDAEERLRNEEAQRWLLLDARGPSILRQYLAGYARRPGSSNWLLNLPPEVDPAGLAALAADTTLLARHQGLLRELDIRSPLSVLQDNQRLVRVQGADELRRALAAAPTRVPAAAAPASGSAR